MVIEKKASFIVKKRIIVKPNVVILILYLGNIRISGYVTILFHQFKLCIEIAELVLIICQIISTAGKPKKDDAMKSLCLMLGPDFITEILEVGL